MIPPPVLPGAACLGASARGKSFPGLQREPWSQRDCKGGQAEIPLPGQPRTAQAASLQHCPLRSSSTKTPGGQGRCLELCGEKKSPPHAVPEHPSHRIPQRADLFLLHLPQVFFFGRHHTFTSSSGLPFQTAAESEGKGGAPFSQPCCCSPPVRGCLRSPQQHSPAQPLPCPIPQPAPARSCLRAPDSSVHPPPSFATREQNAKPAARGKKPLTNKQT